MPNQRRAADDALQCGEEAQNWTAGTGLVNEYKTEAGRPARMCRETEREELNRAVATSVAS